MTASTKSILLLGPVSISAFLFWLWAEPWIANPFQLSQTEIWLKPLLALGFLAAFVGLSFLLIKNGWFKFAASVLAGLPFLFVFDFNKFYLVAFALIVLLHSSAAKKIGKQVTERVKIDIREIMGHGLPSVITPILLLVSFAFFFSPGLQASPHTYEIGVGASAARQELPPTAHEVISRIVVGLLGGELEQLPPEERQKTEKLLVEQVFDRFNQILGPYFKFLPPILAFGLFLILQGLSFVFVWLGTLIAMLLFWILKKLGLIQIVTTQVEAERVEF